MAFKADSFVTAMLQERRAYIWTRAPKYVEDYASRQSVDAHTRYDISVHTLYGPPRSLALLSLSLFQSRDKQQIWQQEEHGDEDPTSVEMESRTLEETMLTRAIAETSIDMRSDCLWV